MKILILTTLFTLTAGIAQAQSNAGSSMMSCPPNTYLRIDPAPRPTDDPARPDTYKPMTALEKEQATQLATQSEMARMHCMPMSGNTPSQ